MERDHQLPHFEKSNLGLQVITHEDGMIEPIFTVSDGVFEDLTKTEEFYKDLIDEQSKELKKLYSIMAFATAVQAYQIVEGIKDENPSVVLPIALVAILMVYIRNKSIEPTKEYRNITTKKLQLIKESVMIESTDELNI
jgi:hypothetical protein